MVKTSDFDSENSGSSPDAATILRGWARAYRAGPAEFRFPSDPEAEFFPRDMEFAADEIDRLRLQLATR